jgi:hypothetical protein
MGGIGPFIFTGVGLAMCIVVAVLPLRTSLVVAGIWGVAVGGSYLLALAGEPSNLWFWRDVLEMNVGR